MLASTRLGSARSTSGATCATQAGSLLAPLLTAPTAPAGVDSLILYRQPHLWPRLGRGAPRGSSRLPMATWQQSATPRWLRGLGRCGDALGRAQRAQGLQRPTWHQSAAHG